MIPMDAVPTTDPSSFIQWGVLGVVLFMLLTGWLWAKPAVDDLRKRLADAEERILPAIEKLTREIDLLNQRMSMRGDR